MAATHIYPGRILSSDVSVDSPRIQAYKLKNPERAFNELCYGGQRNELFFMDSFIENGKESKYYTTSINNHFQGIARHLDGQYFILSGGNVFDKKAALFVFKLESYLTDAGDIKYKNKYIRSNTILPKNNRKLDHIQAVYNFKSKYWHAGGISFLGDILMVPLENKSLTKDKSIIAFVNFRDPLKPKLYKLQIVRQSMAGSVSMIPLKNNHFLLAVWTEDGGPHFSFYLSKSTRFYDGFEDPVDVHFKDFKIKDLKIEPRLQGFQFVQNTDGSKIYVMGNDRGKVYRPDQPDKLMTSGRRFLIQIELADESTRDVNPVLNTVDVSVKNVIGIPNGYQSYDFNSAGGFYTDDKSLYMYGGSTFRSIFNANLRITEFTQRLGSAGQCKKIKDAVIELYTEEQYGGRCLVLQVDRIKSIADFKDIEGVQEKNVNKKINRKHFNDCIQSIRFKMPKDTTYRLYEDKDFNDKKSDKNYLDLHGTGKLVEIPSLKNKDLSGLLKKKSFANKISSARLVIN